METNEREGSGAERRPTCATPFCGAPATDIVSLPTIEYELCGPCATALFERLWAEHPDAAWRSGLVHRQGVLA